MLANRWYQSRVSWPEAVETGRAPSSPAAIVRASAKALARGKADVAKQRIRELIPFWNSIAPRENEPGLADQVLHVANAIGDPQLAIALVEPLSIELMTPKMAARWSDLLTRYGLPWCAEVFERWTSHDERHYDHKPRTTWLASLPALSAPLCARGGDAATELVRRIARAQWTWLNARLDEPNMGLTSWSGGRVLKRDVRTAKNCLDDHEVAQPDHVMFLDQAEFRAQRRKDIKMAEWTTALDKFLRDTELPVLSALELVRCRTRTRSIRPKSSTRRSPSDGA